jgi:hypothetical protein
VTQSDAEQLDRKIDTFAQRLPRWAARFLRWLKAPSSRLVRIPMALLLIGGGLLSFLPFLGFWMLPLGAILLAQDVPLLQRPLVRSLTWLERQWRALKLKFRRRSRRDELS